MEPGFWWRWTTRSRRSSFLGYLRDGKGDPGFTLLETIVSLCACGVLVAVVMPWLLSVWMGLASARTEGEVYAMHRSMERMLVTDGHAAMAVTVAGTTLTIVRADGASYRYAVNALHELVRTGVNGAGTWVVATNVARWNLDRQPRLLIATVEFTDGSTTEVDMSLGEGGNDEN